MIFAAIMPRNTGLCGHLVLARRVSDGCFFRIESISPRNHVHHFTLHSAKDIDQRFCQLLAEAYAVGRQEHVRQARSSGNS